MLKIKIPESRDRSFALLMYSDIIIDFRRRVDQASSGREKTIEIVKFAMWSFLALLESDEGRVSDAEAFGNLAKERWRDIELDTRPAPAAPAEPKKSEGPASVPEGFMRGCNRANCQICGLTRMLERFL